MTATIVSFFDDPSGVRRALSALQEAGVPLSDVTISSRDVDIQGLINSPEPQQISATSSVGAGAAVGGAAGMVVTAAAAALVGPASAPLFVLFGLGGGMLGALYGSVAGAIVGTGYQIEHVRVLEESLTEGKILLAVRADETQTSKFRAVLTQAGGVDPLPVSAHS